MENNRGQWGSNFGFLMAAVGSAVGLGNIWGFPYKMGMSGGFAFLLVYLVLVALVGIVVMLGELTLGRLTGKGTMGAYIHFSKKYAWVGFMGVFSGFLILSFYSVLGGMVMRYMIGYMLQLLVWTALPLRAPASSASCCMITAVCCSSTRCSWLSPC